MDNPRRADLQFLQACARTRSPGWLEASQSDDARGLRVARARTPSQEMAGWRKPLHSESRCKLARKKLMRAILGIYNGGGPMVQDGTVEPAIAEF